jgi:hypothetical protein
MESIDAIRTWHDLYVMLGTSAAALIGLIFIATSLHIREVVSNPGFRIRLHTGAVHLLTFLIQAIFVLVPQPIYLLGAELCLANLIGLLPPLRNAYRYFYSDTDLGRRGGMRIYRLATFAAAYLVALAGGAALVEGSSWGMYLVTASYATVLVGVVLGAWVAMLGIGETEKLLD